MRATTPLVTAAAMLVPLKRRYRASFSPGAETRLVASCLYSEPAIAASETSAWPGATMSGFARPEYHAGPRELYGATASSKRDTVFCVFSAPTVMTDGALPGDVIPA